MKPYLKLLTLICTAMTLAACVIHTGQMSPVASKQPLRPKAHKALVVFFRPMRYGGLNQATLYDGDQYIGTISSKMQIAYQANPGKHLFMVVGESADFLRATLLPGKTYYAEVVPRVGLWKTRFSFRPINGQVPMSKVQQWVAECQLVKVNASGYAWYEANKASVMSKKAKYLREWLSKPKRDQQTLYAGSGV